MWPFELTATPEASPRYMSLGSLIASGTESNAICGTAWPKAGAPASAAASRPMMDAIFMRSPRGGAARIGARASPMRRRGQGSPDPPSGDFSHRPPPLCSTRGQSLRQYAPLPLNSRCRMSSLPPSSTPPAGDESAPVSLPAADAASEASPAAAAPVESQPPAVDAVAPLADGAAQSADAAPAADAVQSTDTAQPADAAQSTE